MNAKLISAKLYREDNDIYWELTLADSNDNIIGTFGSKSDTLNFRAFTFGLTEICNNQNLFNLTNKRISSHILVKRSPTRIESIANDEGDFLTIDNDAKISYGKGVNVDDYESGTLTSLTSKSGILMAGINIGFESQYFQAPSAYIGFKPVYDVDLSLEQQTFGANYFAAFIYHILKICKIDNLIEQNCSQCPEVSIELNNDGKIISLGDKNGKIWLSKADGIYTLSQEPFKSTPVKRK